MSPSLVAVSERLWEFEPASGSVMAKAILSSPVANRGSHRCFWASVPNLAMMVAQMAGETTMTSSGHPAAASSSATAASSVIPPPPPPYCSGTLTPRNPGSATAFHSSSVRWSACAFFT
jgi:hypothetical protein